MRNFHEMITQTEPNARLERAQLGTATGAPASGPGPSREPKPEKLGRKPVVSGTQSAGVVLPLSLREERAGREPERGETDKKCLLSPALSSFFEEERERKRGCALKANFLPNTTGL